MKIIDGTGLEPVRHRLWQVYLVALALLALGSSLQCVRAYRAVTAEHAGQVAMAAANSEVPALLSYGISTLDADLARGASMTTGNFAQEYSRLVRQSIGPVARKNQVVTSATIAANSVVSETPTEVVLLLYVDQQSSSLKQPTPRITQSRLKITMARAGGRWLIGGLQPV